MNNDVNVFPILKLSDFLPFRNMYLQLLLHGAKSWWNHSSHEINASESMRFRNSRLTMLLRDSLGGDSKTLMSWQPSESRGVSFLSGVEKSSHSRREKKWTGKKRNMCCLFYSWYDHINCVCCLACFAEVHRSADIFRSLYNLRRRGCEWKGFLVLIRLGPAAFKVFMMQQTMDPLSIGARTIIIDQNYMQLVGFKPIAKTHFETWCRILWLILARYELVHYFVYMISIFIFL